MPTLVLLCIGIFAIILELFLGSFFLCFLGIGFIVGAIITLAFDLSIFGNIYVMQTLIVSIVSIISLFTLRKPLKRWFNRSTGYKEGFSDMFSEVQEGEVREGMVYFKGTLWRYEPYIALKDGQKVRIKGIKNNKVLLECA